MRKLIALIILFTFSGCVGSPAHKTITYNHIQKTIKENNAALLELRAGMSQSEVSNIIGEPKRNEGYPWGTIWLYRTAMSDIYGTTDSDFTPVMFDQDGILQGWGRNYFEQYVNKYELTIKQEKQ